MDSLPAELVPILDEWTHRGAVVLAKRSDIAGCTPGLYAKTDVFPPVEEVACEFDVPRLVPVEGEEVRALTFEDFAVCLGAPHAMPRSQALHITLYSEIAPEYRPEWMTGSALEATGVPLEIFRAFWAVRHELERITKLQDAYELAEEASPFKDSQGAYVEACSARLPQLGAARRALQAYATSRIRQHLEPVAVVSG